LVKFQAGGAAATVVAASAGYPGNYPKGRGITITPVGGSGEEEVIVFHAGTKAGSEGGLTTSGGRVLAVTGRGEGLKEAIAKAYEGVAGVKFDGMEHRTDIGHRALADRTAPPAGAKKPVRIALIGSTRGTLSIYTQAISLSIPLSIPRLSLYLYPGYLLSIYTMYISTYKHA
jgi:hypothetical protein